MNTLERVITMSAGEKKTEIFMVDTTLRDGEQTAGVVFANHEKLAIAKMLDELGVHQIEAGTPVMGGDEQAALKSIVKANLKASIMGWNRAVVKDIQSSIDCGVDAVAISISTSDIHIQYKLQSSRERVLEQMVEAVDYAKSQGVYISVNAEDASRSDEEFLQIFAQTALQAGADRLRYCDTVGILDPFTTYDKIQRLRAHVPIPVEMHTHNDFGMATANALAGIQAGASYVGVTVNGLGERAGNAALEEVAMALKHLLAYDMPIRTGGFLELCHYVAGASNRSLPVSKPIVGKNMFFHESGIHVDGALKNSRTYEAFDPEEVGLDRQILIGKHSGTAAIKNKFAEFGLPVSEEQAKLLVAKIRCLAVELKRTLAARDLQQLYLELFGEGAGKNEGWQS